MFFSKFKQRYSELLQQTQETNQNWGDEFYDKDVGNAIWNETKKTYKQAVSIIVEDLISLRGSKQEDGYRAGWQGLGDYSGGIRLDDDRVDYDDYDD